MSYCVNCGVELDPSAKKCPLCHTLVFNPNEVPDLEAQPPFPKEKGVVEKANRKDFGILLTVFVLATAITCGMLNLIVFNENLWSLAVAGVCVIVWVWLFPIVIGERLSPYCVIFLDGLSVALYLYMLACMIGKFRWCYGLGIPIVIFLTLLAETLALCIRKLPRSFLSINLYVVTAIAVGCAGLEVLIDRYCRGEISLSWSAIVMTVCIILDVTIITMLSHRRLRGVVRRRLHF